MKNGWYQDKYEAIISQTICGENGNIKGIKSILEERNLWVEGMLLKDARILLKTQSDFLEQKSWLRETVESDRLVVEFSPKFHPKFNPIKRI